MTTGLDAVRNRLWAPFHDGAAAGRLMLPYCVATDRPFWPPSPTSPFAGGGEVFWREHTAEGRLMARVTYRRSFLKAFDPRLPYGVGQVEVAPDVRLQAHMIEPDNAASPQAGDIVALTFRPLIAGGAPVLVIAGDQE
jgi:hypothetical protein